MEQAQTQTQAQEKKLTAKDYVFLVSQGVSNTVLVFWELACWLIRWEQRFTGMHWCKLVILPKNC